MIYTFEYFFEKVGSIREKYNEIGNEIWLDVGGDIKEGTFDHHTTMYKSTVDILINRLDLLEKTKQALDKEKAVRIVTHNYPDIDALFSVYLLEQYLNSEREEYEKKFVHSPLGKSLATYVNDIDTGRKKDVTCATLYAMLCLIDEKKVLEHWELTSENEHGLHKKIVDATRPWIKMSIQKKAMNPEYDLYGTELETDECDEVARIIKEVLKEASDAYKKDLEEGRCKKINILLWSKDEAGKEIVKEAEAAIWNTVPSSPATGYLFARNQGVDITFVPQCPQREGGSVRVKTSINLDKEGIGDKKYTLRNLAERYEQLEQIYERKHLKDTGTLRRDYSRPRTDREEDIFNKKPFSLTDNPWYVNNEGDMVDTPREGSLIPISEMIEVLMNITKMVKKTYLAGISLETGKMKELQPVKLLGEKMSMTGWTETVEEELSKNRINEYPLIVVEIDSAMIAHNYDILDSYFLGLLKGTHIDSAGKNVLHLDYRTHLYVNQAFAVLFIATPSNGENKKNAGDEKNKTEEPILQMQGMLEWENGVPAKQSRIIGVFGTILFQREKLKELGKYLENFKKNERQLNKKNSELISLLAKAATDQCMDSQVELDIYEFVYNALNIPSLKDTVKETMTIVSEYTKERAYASFNWLSTITIPFAIVTAILDVGFIQLKPAFVWSDKWSISSGGCWLIYAITVFIVTVVVYLVRKKK